MLAFIKSFISRYIFSDDLPLEGRIFNLVLTFGILAEFIAVIARIIEGVSSIAVLAVLGMMVVTAAAFYVCNKFNFYRLGIRLAIIIICDILFPLVFFTSGGVDSGMAGYFVLTLALIFFLVRGRGCFFMVLIHIIILIGCYMIGKFYPGTVIPFKHDFPRYVDIIQTILVSGILIGMLVKYQNRIYEKEKLKAEAATKAKAEFLANVSHEIRTPLNAIIGLGELELSRELPGETHINLEKIHNSGMVLLHIINDLLDVSKIESGHFALIPGKYQVSSFINDTVNINMVRIGSKPIRFKLSIDENIPGALIGDELRIRQILNNLLSNAFKYTKEGTVELFIGFEEKTEDSLYLVCTVRDTGIGIKAEDISRLFSAYNQLDSKSNRHIEGTGLGLSISKNLAEMMDGSISVKSEYGTGSAFTVRIRQGIAVPESLGADAARALETFHFAVTREKRQGPRFKMPYARVLVVDDVQINLDVAQGMMLSYGLTVDCVLSGPEAIQLLREEKVRYDAVFMDHMMPGMDGIEAVRIIREEIDSDYAGTVPIIALTANAITGNEEMFLSAGFQAFLSKPIDSVKLDAVLNKWVRNKEKEAALPAAGAAVSVPESGSAETAGEAAPTPSAAVSAAAGPAAFIPPDGLDYQLGLSRFGGRAEAFLRILASFAAGLPELLDKVRPATDNPALEGEALSGYITSIHGLKGACRGAAAMELGGTAEELEMAAERGDTAFTASRNGAFVEAAEQFLAELKKSLAAASVPPASMPPRE
ncbi:MAG: response regulator [Treponema sp.]|jgi:signal transduction histidine kinase/DNA-binding NarL/FixJ family response regulator/HPt (histidine-containing phosphotransfer) domain-containing protein|nr:response regulator [Treponema sp.]